MSAQSESIIEDMNNIRDAAYDKIKEAVRDLYGLGVAESAILLSLRIIYRDIQDEETQQ